MKTAPAVGVGFIAGVLVTIAITTQTNIKVPGITSASSVPEALDAAEPTAGTGSAFRPGTLNASGELGERTAANQVDSLGSPAVATGPTGAGSGAALTPAKLEQPRTGDEASPNAEPQDGTENDPGESERSPIPLPEGVELDGTVAEMHARLERELEDPSWAAVVETEIANYLAQKPGLQDFSVPVIECRQTLCEIQWISYEPNPYATWLMETEDFFQQPWNVFQGMGVNTFVTAPGVQATVIVLTQDPPSPPPKGGSRTQSYDTDSAQI